MAFAGPKNVGAFVPTTNVWDVSELYSVDVKSPEFKELLVRLYQNINNIALVLNIKDSGYYTNEEEFVNSQLYFPDPDLSSESSSMPTFRQVYRKVINFGVLPNVSSTKAVPHNINITDSFSFTRIYATASDQTGLTYLPIPYVSYTPNADIELFVDATDVNITVGMDRSNYTKVYVVLEYLKF